MKISLVVVLMQIVLSASHLNERRVLDYYQGEINRDVLRLDEYVTSIELFHCNITSIDNGILCLPPYLSTLNLQAESIFPKLDNKVFKYCHYLKNLIINGISIEPGAFQTGLEKIERINFYSVDLNAVISKETLRGLENAWDLQIVKSQIKSIRRNAFDDMVKLTELNLESNEIERLEYDTFKNLKKLERLSLSDNKIATLSWNEFRGLRLLDTLSVRGNRGLERTWRQLLANLPAHCKALKSLEIGKWFEYGDPNMREFEEQLWKKFSKSLAYY